MMLHKLNTIFESVVKKDTSFSSTNYDNSRFDFKTDENNNVICTFSLYRDSEKYIIIAKYFDEKLSFSVIDEKGETQQMSEKEFATTYFKDYDKFKEAFNLYNKDKQDFNELAQKEPKINQFGDVIKSAIQNNGAKDEKIYTINNMNFVFRMLKDQTISNYCECLFQINDEANNELVYYKALIVLKKKNSTVIKIMVFDKNGNIKEPMTLSELNKDYPVVYNNLLKAIIKMQKYIESQNDEI